MPTIVEEPRRVSPPPPVPPADRGGDGDSGDSSSSFPISKWQVGIWILLTAIIMLFAGLSSAYIVLRGVPAWQNIQLPSLLWTNTAVLLLSSLAIELSRRAILRSDLPSMRRWLSVGGVLGLAFLAGQLAAWRQLVNAGVYLPSTLQSSFFYILTGLHGLHLMGGVVALSIVLVMAFKNRLSALRYEPLKLCSTYWHVMDALWVWLFLLLLLS
ncbi:MAG TPA: cytochrome c oxidase subunit 3 [Terriglobia bacterium]|nr:cytochrome c oxidase subunit 3 [Terriglobia bacterium]